MRLSLPSGDVWMTCISTGRAGNVHAMEALAGPLTWYVSEHEVLAYLNETTGGVRGCTPGVAHARNRALSEAFGDGLPCVQLDDDLRRVLHATGTTKADCTVFDVHAAVQLMLIRLLATPYRLAGVPPTDNPYFMHKVTSTNLFIIGSFTLTLPSHQRYDERLPLKEDYDFTLQHIEAYGGALRCNDILASFRHYTNAGGVVEHRTAEEEESAITALLGRWPGRLRRNPKRLHEVLLTVKQRAVCPQCGGHDGSCHPEPDA